MGICYQIDCLKDDVVESIPSVFAVEVKKDKPVMVLNVRRGGRGVVSRVGKGDMEITTKGALGVGRRLFAVESTYLTGGKGRREAGGGTRR